tara:strand:+ start:12462 stop:12899 length:438 start_codon:yes stop_codon:yes gene_type:complete
MPSYKGKYRVRNYRKYKGDPTRVVYRSLWERKFMDWCDKTPRVVEWWSEEIAIPYKDPVQKKWRRYFPDFWVKVKETNGKTKSYLIEVKPKRQVDGPKPQKRHTKKYITEVMTYATNQAKWEAANDYCNDRLWEFKLITELELKI